MDRATPTDLMAGSQLPPRVRKARKNLDITRGPGLEVSPLTAPLITKDEADVRYVDLRDADGLREYYRDDFGVEIDDILDVDYALMSGSELQTLPQATAAGAPFEWIMASHVAEHIPDLIGWFDELAEVLVDEGRLSLVIPDKRFCFDVLRPTTTVGELLLAHDSADARPSIRAVYDYLTGHRTVDSVELWRGYLPGEDRRMFTNERIASDLAKVRRGEYVDSHVWVFTPETFVNALDALSHLGVLEFTIADIMPTERDDLEFFVTLERLPRALALPGRRERFVADWAVAKELVAAAGVADDPDAPDAPPLVPSAREYRMLAGKRRVVEFVKGRR
jgi:hypothetical protein